MKLTFDRDTRRRWKDITMSVAAVACVIIALIPLGSILFESVVRGLAAVNPSLFLTNTGAGGIGNAIQGTLILILLSSAIALPIGILAGIYIAEYGKNWLGRTIRFFTDVMTQIPSIVIGIFVFSLMFVLSQEGVISPMTIYSARSGAIALAVVMVPFITRTTDEALRLVPGSTREAALALGIPRYKVTLRIVLSSSSSALVTGALLAIARGVGETAPLLVTAGGSSYGFLGLDQPIASLTVGIYTFASDPRPSWHEAAWGATLVLVAMVLAMSVITRFVFRRRFGVRGEGI